MLERQKKTGYFGDYGVNKVVLFDNYMLGPDAETAKAAWGKYVHERSDRRKLEAAILSELSRHDFQKVILEHLTGEFFGTYKWLLDEMNAEQLRRGKIL